MFHQPDFRYLEALRLSKNKPRLHRSTCPLAHYLAQEGGVLPLKLSPIAHAHAVYLRNMQSKLVMEALLVAPDSSNDLIAQHMRTDIEMVQHYRHYFFDPGVFQSMLELTDYISTVEDESSRNTKILAITQGFHFVLSHLTGGDIKMSPVDVNKKLMGHAMHMFLQSRAKPVTAEVSKETKSWAMIAKSSADFLAKAEADPAADFMTEFRVLFKTDNDLLKLSSIEGEIFRG